MHSDSLSNHSRAEVRKGWENRQSVLGEEYTRSAVANASRLSSNIQEWATEDVWGKTWGREGLDWPSRSLVTIALLIAGGHQNELRAHVRGGLRNGLDMEQIIEVVRHCAVYCGAPVTLAASRTVAEVLEEESAPRS